MPSSSSGTGRVLSLALADGQLKGPLKPPCCLGSRAAGPLRPRPSQNTLPPTLLGPLWPARPFLGEASDLPGQLPPEPQAWVTLAGGHAAEQELSRGRTKAATPDAATDRLRRVLTGWGAGLELVLGQRFRVGSEGLWRWTVSLAHSSKSVPGPLSCVLQWQKWSL